MSTRIRYRKNSFGELVSNKVIPTNHGDMVVKYNPGSKMAMIVTATEPIKVIDSFAYVNEFALKKTLKAKLTVMGAVFESETRGKGEDHSNG